MTGDKSMKESRVLKTIDNVNEWVGRVASFAYVAVLLFQIMEVVLRYVFNSPTIWAWDVNAQLFMGTTILGGGYVLLHDGHVRVDVLYGRVSPKKRAILDLISFPLAIIALALMTWQLGDMALESWQVKERGPSFFAPPIYPLKTTYLIGVFLLLLQAIAYTYRRLRFLIEQDITEKGEI
jgi:TRAP-type mannitol/chloroaromatic compound transport system permease small subunit